MMQPTPYVKQWIVFFFYVLCSFFVCVAAPGLKETMKKYKYKSKKLIDFLSRIIPTFSLTYAYH